MAAAVITEELLPTATSACAQFNTLCSMFIEGKKKRMAALVDCARPAYRTKCACVGAFVRVMLVAHPINTPVL